jgi:hypothetical protein
MAAALYEKFAQGLGDEDDLEFLIAFEQSEQVAFAKIDAALLEHEEDDPQENVKQYTAMFKMLFERGFRPSYAYYDFLDMHDWDDLLGFYDLLASYHLPIHAWYLIRTVELFEVMHLEEDGEWLLRHIAHMLFLFSPSY